MRKRKHPRQAARRRQRASHAIALKSLYRRPLRYEPLEDRRLLAVVTVNTLLDVTNLNDNLTTLREAIFATNLVAGADTINFDPALTASGPATILLTQGELKITDDLTIAGPGAHLLTIDASGNDPTPTFKDGRGTRVFHIGDGDSNLQSDVSLVGMTLTGGDVADTGGAILSLESLSVFDSTLRDNAGITGGAIYAIAPSGGKFQLADSVVSRNQATSAGGGVWVRVSAGGTAIINQSKVSENLLTRQIRVGTGGGIYVANPGGGNASILGSDIRDNVVNDSGGGIFCTGPLSIIKSAIANNTAQISGGGIAYRDTSFLGSSTLSIVECNVLNNTASAGGGIELYGAWYLVCTVANSEIVGNQATKLSNRPQDGGGILLECGSLQITSSTISGNEATHYGGGIATASIAYTNIKLVAEDSTIASNVATSGGGIAAYRGGLTIIRSTVARNQASGQGGGIYADTGNISVDHSIIATNSIASAPNDFGVKPSVSIATSFSLIGHNATTSLSESPVGLPDSFGNLVGGSIYGAIDPRLRPLADYGGPTPTHALDYGSPAINAGDASVVAGVNGVPLFDQRGAPYSRVAGGRIDIGATEFGVVPSVGLLVDILVDEFDQDFAPGDLSLREAIYLANLVSDANIIRFSPTLVVAGPPTITLTHGALPIVGSVSIIGPGAARLTIDAGGNDPTPEQNDGLGSSIFEIGDSTDGSLDVILSNLTLTGGDSRYGGAVLNTENLTITGCNITGNYAVDLGGGIANVDGSLIIDSSVIARNQTDGDGGGIAVSEGTVVIDHSMISANSGHSGGGVQSFGSELSIANTSIENNTVRGRNSLGGGVFNKAGELTIANCIVSGNTGEIGAGVYSDGDATIIRSKIVANHASGSGGGVYAFGNLNVRETTIASNAAGLDGGGLRALGGLLIDGSTLSGNSAIRSGGGVWIEAQGEAATIINTTVSTNSASGSGGGIWASGGVQIHFSTVTRNSSDVDHANGGAGGGLYTSLGDTQLNHVIIAGNWDNSGAAFDVAGAITLEHSLIGSNLGSGLTPAPVRLPDGNGNLIGGAIFAAFINPLLGPLANNGGVTLPDGSRIFTHALLPGSPAINAGDLNLKAGVAGVPAFDQRGTPFGRVVNGRIDLGAFEYQAASDLNLLVDTLVDESDGDYTRGDLSLREAIELANLWPSVDTIRFDPALTASGPATILLTRGELTIADSLTINGPGAELLTIDASGNDPTPTIIDGRGTRLFSIGNAIDVAMSGLTLTGGDSSLRGGAIFNKVANSITLRNTVITGNATREFGGGIYATSTKVLIESTTITNNIASSQSEPGKGGGGVFVRSGNLTVRDSVISGNAAFDGGGVYFRGDYGNTAASIMIERSTISGNQALDSGGGVWTRLYSGSMTVADSIIESNIAGRLSPRTGGGGGIYASLRRVSPTISGTVVRNNDALIGAGMYLRLVSGNADISNAQISRNHAFGQSGSGGGVYTQGDAATLTIRDSTLNDNTSTFGSGGGVFASFVGLTVLNSTISANSATSGGGVFQGSGPLHVHNSTVIGNFVPAIGGIGGIIAGATFSTSFEFSISNSIVAGNYALLGSPSDVSKPNTHSKLSVHYSLIGYNGTSGLVEAPLGSPDANGNLIGGPVKGVIDPKLGPLADNGGPTQTHALLAESPAIDAGDPAAASGVDGVPLHDQRGAPFIRAYGGRIDMGAVESQPAGLLGDYNANGVVDAADYVVWRKLRDTDNGRLADGNGDGQVNDTDYTVWRTNFGQTAATLAGGMSGNATASAPAFVEAPARTSPARRPVFAAAQANEFRLSTTDYALLAVTDYARIWPQVAAPAASLPDHARVRSASYCCAAVDSLDEAFVFFGAGSTSMSHNAN